MLLKADALIPFVMQESLGSKFKRQLHALMAAIERTEVQYVRCIKPNSNKSKDELDHAMVVEQLRCAGVIEVRVLLVAVQMKGNGKS